MSVAEASVPLAGAGAQGSAHAEPAAAASLSESALVKERIRSCQGLVRSIAWGIGRKLPPHVEMDDLVSCGQVGLAQAARDFDASRGNRFTTYAFYRIRGAIYDGMSRMSWFKWHDYHGSKYEQMANELLEVATEFPPETDSSAQAEGQWVAETGASLAICYLAGEAGLADRPSADWTSDPEAKAVREELVDRLRRFIDQLPSDARLLITSVYYEDMTLEAAGKRLGVSKSWASRLHARTIKRLGRAMRLSGAEQ